MEVKEYTERDVLIWLNSIGITNNIIDRLYEIFSDLRELLFLDRDKILGIGNKIDLTRTSAIENISEPSNLGKVYVSQILDIIDDEKLKIGMPIEQGKIKLFPINSRLDACFYTANGLYQGKLLVTDRYKEDAIFILVVEVISNLHKYQRRQYYRLGCIIDIKYKILQPIITLHVKMVGGFIQNEKIKFTDTSLIKG